MWFFIILGFIGVVGIFIVHDANSEKFKSVGGLMAGVAIVILTISTSLLSYHRGKSVSLSNMPHSLSEGTIYTVITTADGFALITNNKKEGWVWNPYQKNQMQTWLVELTQKNVQAGGKYIVVENPELWEKNGVDSKILVKYDP